MKKVNIVKELKTNHSAAVANVPDRKLAAIVQAIGATITANLVDATGKIAVGGIGAFVSKKKEVEKEGVKSTVTRISFKPAAPKVAGEGKKKGKKKREQKGEASAPSDLPAEE